MPIMDCILCCYSALALCVALIVFLISKPYYRLQVRVYAVRMWRRMVGKDSKSVARRAIKYVQENCESGNPDLALATMDKFCVSTGSFMMNVGPEKGTIVDKEIARCKPKVALEMGAYCGYSAVRMARLIPPGQGRLISFEIDPDYADLARTFIKFSGVDDRVEVVLGDSSTIITQLKDRFGVTHVDFVFLDHRKDKYLPDLKLLEKHDLLCPGSVIVADNILYPGNPKFKAHMLSSPNYEVVVHSTHVEYSTTEDEVIVAEFLG